MRGGDHRRSREERRAGPLCRARIIRRGVGEDAEHGSGPLHQRNEAGIASAQVAYAPRRRLALALEGHEDPGPRRQLGLDRRPDSLQACSILGHGQDPPARPGPLRAHRRAELGDQQQVLRRAGGEAGGLNAVFARPHGRRGGQRTRIAPADQHAAHASSQGAVRGGQGRLGEDQEWRGALAASIDQLQVVLAEPAVGDQHPQLGLLPGV